MKFLHRLVTSGDLPAMAEVRRAHQAQLEVRFDHLEVQLERSRIMQGLVLEAARKNLPVTNLAEVEFGVFSQFADDGIITYLIDCLSLPENLHRFVEFGVQDYRESNTRYLLVSRNWRGLVMDGDEKNIEFIRGDGISWRHDLESCVCWITRDNINEMLQQMGFSGDIGLLHVDIDGNDYWVWKNIDVISPCLVILEYNSTFGSDRSVTIPYDENFLLSQAHFSGLYWGASLAAMIDVSNQKGYEWIGCNSAGNNAYFVRRDYAAALSHLRPARRFVSSKFRDSRHPDGSLSFLKGDSKLQAIRDKPLVDISGGHTILCGDLLPHVRGSGH